LGNQEAFDGVWTAFVVEKAPPSYQPTAGSWDTDHRCLYRGPNGEKCAAGTLIPDDLYNPLMDFGGDSSISNVMDQFPLVRDLFEGVDRRLLTDLQTCCHDEAVNWVLKYGSDFHSIMERELRRIGDKWNLTVPAAANV
jgi:hypothetical protein